LSDTGTKSRDYDIWYLEKKNNLWTGPYNAGPIINTEKDEFFPSVASNGNLYFTRDNDSTKEDIFVSVFTNNKYTVPVALPKEVNSPSYDFNAFIDPDETYIIFSSYKRTDDHGGGDLYIASRNAGEWQTAKNMGDGINSISIDYCPFVSFDKKHFFFTTKKNTIKIAPKMPLNAGAIRRLLSSCGNGTDDIYVVDFGVIDNILK
jgi:hypothetical protein